MLYHPHVSCQQALTLSRPFQRDDVHGLRTAHVTNSFATPSGWCPARWHWDSNPREEHLQLTSPTGQFAAHSRRSPCVRGLLQVTGAARAGGLFTLLVRKTWSLKVNMAADDSLAASSPAGSQLWFAISFHFIIFFFFESLFKSDSSCCLGPVCWL